MTKVLDKGSVELIDHMGTDLSVVDAARVSFSKESEWDWGSAEEVGERCIDLSYEYLNKKLKDKDVGLINYLAKHNHWTPFGQVNIKFRIKMPIFVARQAMRSNVGIVWNEESRRYIDSEPEFYEPDVWRGRPEGSIKQGSTFEFIGGYSQEYGVEDGCGGSEYSFSLLGNSNAACLCEYKHLLQQGVAPEMARMVLPQSTYTTVIANFTLAAAARFVGLRVDSHAQWEIQQYGKAMSELIQPMFPVSWEALTGGK